MSINNVAYNSSEVDDDCGWKSLPASERLTMLLKAGYNMQDAAKLANQNTISKELALKIKSSLMDNLWANVSSNYKDEKPISLDELLNAPTPDDDTIMNMFSSGFEKSKDLDKKLGIPSQHKNLIFMDADEYSSTIDFKKEVQEKFYKDFKDLLDNYNAKLYIVKAFDTTTHKEVCKRLEVRIDDNQFFLDDISHGIDDKNIYDRTTSVTIKDDNYDFNKDVQNGNGVSLYS